MRARTLVQTGGRVVARFAALLLWIYPTRFRRDVGSGFSEVAAHRYDREVSATGRATVAMGRTTWMLCADAMKSAPPMWRGAVIGDRQLPPFRVRMVQWLAQGGDDLKLAVRTCIKQPAFALLVMGTLGLGIGASAAAFGALDRAVLRPLAFPEGDRLALVSMRDAAQGWRFLPSSEALALWRANPRAVTQLGGYQPSTTTYLGGGTPEVVPAANMSPNLTEVLRVRPVAGRVLGPSDVDGATPVVMISESFWRRRYGGAPSVIGRSERFGAVTYTIVGVWPQAARVDPAKQADVFFVRKDADVLRASSWAFVVGRLAPGVTHAQAAQDLTSQVAGLEGSREGAAPDVSSPAEYLSDAYKRGLWLVFGAAILLMVVAVANASNLLLARAASREREVGVRLALGGSTGSLVRLFVVEGATVSVAGGLLAIGVAWSVGRLLASMASGNIPTGHFEGLNATVYGFAAGGSFMALLVCGLVPVAHARAKDIRRLTGFDGDLRVVAGTSRLRQSLIAIQAAVGVVLVAGAILMARSMANLASTDVGFALRELVTVSLVPPQSKYPSPEARTSLLTRIKDELASIPGVTGVVTSGMPFFRHSVQVGEPYLDGEAPPVDLTRRTTRAGAAPGYFDVLGIPLRQGRVFRPDEKGVVMVNESFARAHGGNVIGRRLYQPRQGTPHEKLPSSEIVGVVGDVRPDSGTGPGEIPAQVYMPSAGELEDFARFFIRVSGDPSLVLATARSRVAGLDPELPLRDAATGSMVFRDETAQHRFVAVLLGCLALLGVILAVAGVYGAVAIEVRRRFREAGLRVALGASGAHVVGLFVRRGMRPVVAGAAAGTAAWLWASTLLSALLVRIDARDPISTVAGVGLLSAVAILACVLPARHASRVDPAVTLRV